MCQEHRQAAYRLIEQLPRHNRSEKVQMASANAPK